MTTYLFFANLLKVSGICFIPENYLGMKHISFNDYGILCNKAQYTL